MTNSESSKSAILQGTIWKQIFLFFFPVFFGTLFQILYNTVDAVIVGQCLGKAALSAVGGTPSQLINLLIGFFTGLSTGASVIIAQYYGARKKQQVSDAVHTSLALAIICAIVMTIAGIALVPTIFHACNIPPELYGSSLLYTRVYLLGLTGNLLYNMGAGILRAIGDSKRPFYYLLVGCVLNIILDVLFIVIMRKGVAWAAFATIIAQAASAVCLICHLMNRNDECRLYFRNLRFHKTSFLHIMYIGLPTALQSVMYNLSNLLIQTSINSFGTDVIAAWGAYGKIDCLFWMTLNSFGIAMTTFIGQNYGAGLYERVKSGIKQCFVIVLIITVSISFILYIFSSDAMGLFINDSKVLEIGISMMHFLVPTYVTYITIEIICGSLRAMGDTIFPTIICCCFICLLRLVWIFYVLPVHRTIYTIEASYPISWICTSILFIIYYFLHRKKLYKGKA